VVDDVVPSGVEIQADAPYMIAEWAGAVRIRPIDPCHSLMSSPSAGIDEQHLFPK
jgi:hypothetical protein